MIKTAFVINVSSGKMEQLSVNEGETPFTAQFYSQASDISVIYIATNYDVNVH